MKPFDGYNLVSPNHLRSIIGYDLKYLNTLAKNVNKLYNSFDIENVEKKKWRHIDNPHPNLKKIQKIILKKLLYRIKLPDYFIGSVPKSSIIKNASVHQGQSTILIMDLRRFYPSTKWYKVYETLLSKLKYSTEIATAIRNLTTLEGSLPQGSPTSGFLANLCILDLAKELFDLCQKNNLRITFYVDDIAISGDNPKVHIEEIVNIIHKYHYAVNSKKTKLLSGKYKKVTGVAVDKVIYTPIEYVRQLEDDISDLKQIFNKDLADNLVNQIKGKINFVNQISPEIAADLKGKLNAAIKNKKIIKSTKQEQAYRPCKRDSACLANINLRHK